MTHLSEHTSAIMWAQDMDTAREAFRAGLEQAGVTLYAYVSSRPDIDRTFLDTTYPEAWIARYQERNYFAIDPVYHELVRNTLPFAWRYVTNRSDLTDEQRAFFAEAAAFGLVDGYAIPLISSGGRHASFSFAFESTEHMKTVLTNHPTLRSLVVYYHAAIERMLEQQAPADTLSVVERQCLQCASQGRSLWEISAAIHRSETEVASALRAARVKLGTATIAQAAEKASGLGLIGTVPAACC